MYVSAATEDREAFESLKVAATPDNLSYIVGSDDSVVYLGAADVSYDTFIILDGDNPKTIYHGKVYDRKLAPESTYANVRLLSSTSNLPSDLKDGDLVGVVTEHKNVIESALGYSITGLENGIPNNIPTNGQYLLSDMWNGASLAKGSNKCFIKTYNPVVKVYLHVYDEDEDEEVFHELPQSIYSVDTNGVVKITEDPDSYFEQEYPEEAIDFGNREHTLFVSFRVLMEKTDPFVSLPMEVYIFDIAPSIVLYTYNQEFSALVNVNDTLAKQVDNRILAIDSRTTAAERNISTLNTTTTNLSSSVSTNAAGIYNNKNRINSINNRTIFGTKFDGDVQIIDLEYTNKVDDVINLAFGAQFNRTSIGGGVFVYLTFGNEGIVVDDNTLGIKITDDDDVVYPSEQNKYCQIYDSTGKLFKGTISRRTVSSFPYICCTLDGNGIHLPFASNENLALLTADSDFESNYGVSEGDKYIMINDSNSDAYIDVDRNETEVSVVFDGVNHNETVIYFDGGTTISFVIGNSTYNIVGEVPNFETGTKYVMAIKDNYVVFGTVAADEEEEE